MEYDLKAQEEMTLEDFENIIEQEGDSHEFTYLDFFCSLKRHLELKHWCAYIHLTKDNKLHKSYLNDNGIFAIDMIQVYGGWTYDHLKNDIYIIGFDFAHYNDINILNFRNQSYRNENLFGEVSYKSKAFVISETQKACEQLQNYSISKLRQKKIDEIL